MSGFQSRSGFAVLECSKDWDLCDLPRRLLRNRVSAQQARERKKVYLTDLEVRGQTLDQRNAELEEKVSTLQRENFMLRQVSMPPLWLHRLRRPVMLGVGFSGHCYSSPRESMPHLVDGRGFWGADCEKYSIEEERWIRRRWRCSHDVMCKPFWFPYTRSTNSGSVCGQLDHVTPCNISRRQRMSTKIRC